MLVSFIIPTYNRTHLLIRAIKSIIFSNIPKEDYEIIVIDDGSEIDTKEEVINKFKLINIKFHKYNFNTGNESMMRNTGIKLAVCKYIRFIDDDDYFNSVELFKEYTYIKKNNLNYFDFIFCERVKEKILMINNSECHEIVNRKKRLVMEGVNNVYISNRYITTNNFFFNEKEFPNMMEDEFFGILIYHSANFNLLNIANIKTYSYVVSTDVSELYLSRTNYDKFIRKAEIGKFYNYISELNRKINTHISLFLEKI